MSRIDEVFQRLFDLGCNTEFELVIFCSSGEDGMPVFAATIAIPKFSGGRLHESVFNDYETIDLAIQSALDDTDVSGAEGVRR